MVLPPARLRENMPIFEIGMDNEYEALVGRGDVSKVSRDVSE